MLQHAINAFISSLVSHNVSSGRNNTLAAYRTDLNQFARYLAQQNIENWAGITREDVDRYLLHLREEQAYRPTTIARKMAALKSFFRYLQQSGLIQSNVLEEFEIPRIRKELPAVLSVEQVDTLFAQVERTSMTGQRDLAMLHLLYATGMRVTELVSLNIVDFDAADATVSSPGQRNQGRILPLSPQVIEAMLCYVQSARPQLVAHHPGEQALFVNHHGERLTRQGFWLIVKGYARQAGLQEMTPYMLRHSFALHMLQQGMELRSVQHMLGHAHITTTQVYAQLIAEEAKAPAN